MTQQQSQQVVVVATGTKSPGIAILLTLLFGPLGMLYSTIIGAIVMIPVTFLVGIFTFGLGLLVTWPICIIWAALAASLHNSKMSCKASQSLSNP